MLRKKMKQPEILYCLTLKTQHYLSSREDSITKIFHVNKNSIIDGNTTNTYNKRNVQFPNNIHYLIINNTNRFLRIDIL